MLEDVADRGRQRAQVRDRVALLARRLDAERRQAGGDLVGDLVAEQRAERGDTDRAAHRAEERDHGARRAHVRLGGVVLHREDEVLHGRAEADAEDGHEGADDGQVGGVVDLAEQAQAEDDHHHAADQPALPVAGVADDPAGDDAGDQQAADHRDRHQPGVGGAHAAGELEVLAQVDGRPEHRDADQHRGRGGEARRTVPEEAQRDDRLDGDLRLDVDGCGDDEYAEPDQRGGRGGDPVELVAGQGHPDQQDRDAGDDQGRAEVVDRDLALHHGQVQGLLEQHEGRDGDREADEEAAAPAEGAVHDQAADERAADRRQREDRAEVAGVAAALTRRHHRRDHDLDERGQATHAEALDDAGADQHLHVGREAGDEGAGGEDDQRALHQHLLAEQVGELAPDRRGRGHREQGRDDDPRVAGLAAVQVGDDARERVAHHGAGEHGDEHREEEAAERLEHLAVRHLAGGLGGRGCYLGGQGGSIRRTGKVAESNHISNR